MVVQYTIVFLVFQERKKKTNKKTTQVRLPFSMSEVLFLASDKIKCTHIWSCLGWAILFNVRFWGGFQQPSCQAFSRSEIPLRIYEEIISILFLDSEDHCRLFGPGFLSPASIWAQVQLSWYACRISSSFP